MKNNTVLSLFNLIKQPKTLVKDILDKYTTQSEKGIVFECICNILIKFGFFPKYPNSKYTHLTGSINRNSLTQVISLKQFLLETNINVGNVSGASDITLYDELEHKYIFITCKYPITHEDNLNQKQVNYYGITDIISVVANYPNIYKNYEINVIVPNKQVLLNAKLAANDSSKHITKYIIKENIFDEKDINIYLQHFQESLLQVKLENYDNIFYQKKEVIKLRMHQEVTLNKIRKLILNKIKDIAITHKPRSGKSITIGGMILNESNVKNIINLFYNILIVTPAPNETLTQFNQELFLKYRNFDTYNLINILPSQDINNLNISLTQNNIILVSKQLLQKYINKNAIKSIKKLNLDSIVFDENHFSGTTDLSKDIFNTYSTKDTVKIYVTATYNKSILRWGVIKEAQLHWTTEDELLCKQRNYKALIEVHGQEMATYLDKNKINLEALLSSYDKMPDLHILTNIFDQDRYKIIKENIKSSHYGFSFATLFSFKYNNFSEFQYEKEVILFLQYLTGSEKEKDYKNCDNSIFARINNLRLLLKSRPILTYLMFLPPDNINNISINLKRLLLKNSKLKNYKILIVNSKSTDVTTVISNIKVLIKNAEQEVIKNKLDGLLILAGSMLSLGITLENCDVVLLLNDTLSCDKITQQMYRCMTESKMGDKKAGIVVDLSIGRVINSVITYNNKNLTLTLEDKIRYQIDHRLINIDIDLFTSKKLDSNYLMKTILDIWKNNPIYSYENLIANFDTKDIEFNQETQKQLNTYFNKNISKNIKNISKIEFKNKGDELQTIHNGVERITEIIKTKDKEENKEKIKEVKISFTKDVLPVIIPLICILTIKHKNKTISELLKIINSQEDLLEIFNEQTLIWWEYTDLLDFIQDILEEHFQEDYNINNILLHISMMMTSLIDDPKKLLEFIDNCLKPKQVEKEKFGEVFTPMFIIDNMLDELDNAYIKIHKTSIFSNPNLKWFDPAAGIGNFSVALYLRLFDNLNIKDKKNHILENMIFMSEINTKNSYVIKQIFDIQDNYKLNLNEGDTLLLNTKKKFNVTKFDVILGNPPYNLGGIKSHTGKKLGDKNVTIWPSFVEYAFKHLKEDGYLVYIHPLSWLKSTHSYHNVLLEKQIIWLELWDNIHSKYIIQGKIPISLYVLQNTINKDKLTTHIISKIKSKNVETESTIYLDKMYSIPLAYHSIFSKIIKKIEQDVNLKLEVLTTTVKSKDKTSKSLPKKYSKKDMYGIDTYRIKDGYFVKKMLTEHKDMLKSKLIIANKSSLSGSMIDNGRLGLIGNHKYYILGNNLDKLKLFFETKLGNIISQFTKYNQDFLDKDAFNFIFDVRNVSNTELPNITDDCLFKYLKLTEDEINSIICKEEVEKEVEYEDDVKYDNVDEYYENNNKIEYDNINDDYDDYEDFDKDYKIEKQKTKKNISIFDLNIEYEGFIDDENDIDDIDEINEIKQNFNKMLANKQKI
jgi:hypothetical protein